MLNFILGLLLAYSICITLIFLGSVARWYEAKKDRELSLRILYAVDPVSFYEVVDRGSETPKTAKKEN